MGYIIVILKIIIYKKFILLQVYKYFKSVDTYLFNDFVKSITRRYLTRSFCKKNIILKNKYNTKGQKPLINTPHGHKKYEII